MRPLTPCYEYFDCEQKACPMHGEVVTRCWTMKSHDYSNPTVQDSIEKKLISSVKEKCQICPYQIASSNQARKFSQLIKLL